MPPTSGDEPAPQPVSMARDALSDPIDLKRTRAAVLGRLFGKAVEPTRLGRFEILGVAGHGAMGQVYVARDPELDRRVAIKVIRRFDPDDDAAERQRERLVREARAMAKIQHPNVIAVHEVSRHAEDVFIVMEYVEGPSLRRWLEQTPRAWREVVSVFAGAGKGLAAAHSRELVHRDFKPDNVLVADGRRAIVLDFGLARPPLPEAALTHPGSSFEAGSMATGVAAGTPAYMAPEQIRGAALNAASDQFGFCVALYEALHGRRPFSIVSPDESLAEIRAGPPPPTTRLPEWLNRAIARGLAESPTERWPSMDELVAELERRRLSRPVIALSVVGVAVAAAAGAGLAELADDDAEPVRCDQGTARVAEVWNAEGRAAVIAAFTSSGPAYASTLAERLADRLDAYTTLWAAGYDDACAATHLRGEQSEPLLDQRMACLDRELAELTAVRDLLIDAEEEAIRRAPALVAGLPAVADCADVETLRLAKPLPSDPDVRAAIARAEELLASASANRNAGRFAATETALDEVETMTGARTYGPLEARYLFARGCLLEDVDDPGAERALLDAVASAEVHRLDRLAASCWRRLVRATLGGAEANRRAEGYLERLAASVGRLGSPPRMLALLARARGSVARDAGRFEDAAGHIEEAIELATNLREDSAFLADLQVDLGAVWFQLGRYAEAAEAFQEAASQQAEYYGPDHPFTARTLNNRGVALVAMGENRKAIETLVVAREAIRRGVGADNPSVAISTNALGSAYYQLGEFERAREMYAETIRIYEATLGPAHARLGAPLVNLARCESHLDRHDDAVASAKRALELVKAARGADHIELATIYSGLGHALTRAQRLDDALAAHRESLRIREAKLGTDHAETAYSQQAMADTLRALGRAREAAKLGEAACSTLETTLGAQHPQLASSLLSLGRTQIALGRKADAVTSLERALKIYETAEAPPEDVQATRKALAQARAE